MLWGTFILNILIRYSIRGYRIDKMISLSLIYFIDIQIYLIESDNKSLIVNEIAGIEFQNKLKSARTHKEEKVQKTL